LLQAKAAEGCPLLLFSLDWFGDLFSLGLLDHEVIAQRHICPKIQSWQYCLFRTAFWKAPDGS